MATENEALSQAIAGAATSAADWLVVLPVALPLVGATAVIMMRRHVRLHPAIALAVIAGMIAGDALLLGRVATVGPVTMTMGNWLAPFGISFSVDVLGAGFALVAAIVGGLAAIYALAEVGLAERRFGFYALLLLLLAGVSGAFLTGDIFNLYVWFEVMLISSFGLIVLGGTRLQLDGAVKYGFLNLLATTIFLIAVGALYGATGTLNMADLAIRMRTPPAGVPTGSLAALITFAFAMKAAAFPLNFWLPASYHTPRVVVSAVFAGLLTKVGMYALLRSLIMLFPAAPRAIADVVFWVAIATMLTGALGTLAQTDLRRAAGYLVVSGIGFMLLGAGLGTAAALEGAVIYAVHSMIAITALYLLAGVVARIGRDDGMERLGGLYAASPFAAALFLVITFALTGLPPFSGFWPKAVLVRAAIAEGAWIAVWAMLLTSLVSLLALGRFWTHIFWRPSARGAAGEILRLRALDRQDRGALLGPVAALAIFVMAIGLWPEPVVDLARKSAAGLLHPQAYIESALGRAP